MRYAGAMDIPACNGCRQRDRVIAQLQARVANLEAEVARLHQVLQRQEATILRLTERLARYEPEVCWETSAHASDSSKPSTSYSLDAETQRRRRRRRKKSPGRRPTEQKFADAQCFRDIYPQGIPRDDCQLVRQRAVWRLENGRAVLVGYRVHAGPDGAEPRIPGVTPRCEYGIEILIVLAYLVYVIGISLDKACAVLGFFCQLPLAKSQADALLRQLAHHWEEEFATLCDLLAHAAVVYMDETGWQVGKDHLSLWALASDLVRVFVYGCNKNQEMLDELLPPDVFGGIGVSDDAAVYRHRFVQGQKCWAHLLRKAIRLALLCPRKKKYRRFLDALLDIYRDAKRAAADGRLGEAGRKARVAELEARLADLCKPHWQEPTPDMTEPEHDFTNLVNELVELLMDEELFIFVLVPEVEPTNNRMEREIRGSALDRKAGRTSKTPAGAYRRSVIVSVLESLRANLEPFTLTTVLDEVGRWLNEGISLFAKRWQDLTGSTTEPEFNTS